MGWSSLSKIALLGWMGMSLSLPLAQGTLRPMVEADHWRTTDVDIELTRKYLNNKFCRSDERSLEACQAAVRQLVHMLKSPSLPVVDNAGAVDFDQTLNQAEEFVTASGPRYPRQMIYGTVINDILRHFDDHARLTPVSSLQAKMGEATEETSGLGVDLQITAAGVFVRHIYEDSPAQRAQMHVNDRLVSVNGIEVEPGVRSFRALKHLQGRPGDEVHLALERSGHRRELDLTLASLSLRPVDVRYFQAFNKTYALAKIHSFAFGACSDLAAQLAMLQGQGLGPVAGILLDLRGNLGGVVKEAACVSGLFVGRKTFLSQKGVGSLLPSMLAPTSDLRDFQETRMSPGPMRFPATPLVVLVDASSASAAEMLAAALQDHQRAWIVGETTFGKGTTQKLAEVPGHPSLLLNHTISRYYRPSSHPLQLIGVTPDFNVPFRREASTLERQAPREGDWFGWSLSKEGGAEWTSPRLQEASLIRGCITSKQLDRKFTTWHEQQMGFEDFQKAFALSVLSCAT